MVCFSCKGVLKPVFGNLCSCCFTKMIENRVRKEIGVRHLIGYNDTVLALDKFTFFILKKVVRYKFNIYFNPKPTKSYLSQKHIKKAILITSKEESCNDFLLTKILHKKNDKPYLKNSYVLYLLLNDEIILYSKIKNIEISKKNCFFDDFIKQIENSYPGTIFSFSNSVDYLKDIVG